MSLEPVTSASMWSWDKAFLIKKLWKNGCHRWNPVDFSGQL